MTISKVNWPKDAGFDETTECKVKIDDKDLVRLTQIALNDMDAFFKKGHADLEGQRFCVALGEKAAHHYLHGGGFQCISVWTFFKKSEGVKPFHALRHTRVDFGDPKFGHSSWIKHPSDKGFVGRGINCFGRSIELKKDDDARSALLKYLKSNKSSAVARLKPYPLVLLWPPELFGTVVKV